MLIIVSFNNNIFHSILTGHFQGCIVTFDFADFILGQAIISACIASITFFGDYVQKEERIFQHQSISCWLHFLVILVPKCNIKWITI